MGKVEIARYEQFLLFPQCFQKACFSEASKGVIMWEWINHANNHATIFFTPSNTKSHNFKQRLQMLSN